MSATNCNRTTFENIQDLKITKKIGHGKTSDVFLVRDQLNNSYALKKLKIEYFKNQSSQNPNSPSSDPENEVKVLSDLGNHPHITKLFYFDGQHMVMEFNRNGELFDYICQGSPLFDEDLAHYFFKQMINVVDFLQTNGYSHRDVKPENILLDEQFNIKFADFGFACKQAPGQTHSHVLGTDSYMAPELVRGFEYDGFKVDIFALGVVLFCMVNGFPPYYQKACKNDPYYKFFAEKRTHTYWSCIQRKYNRTYTNEFMSIVTGMLAYNPSDRFSMDQIKSHPWYSKSNQISKDEVIVRMTKIRAQISPSEHHY